MVDKMAWGRDWRSCFVSDTRNCLVANGGACFSPSRTAQLEYYRFEPSLREAVREFIEAEFPDFIFVSEDAGRGEKKEFFVR